jgi:arabinose-5-phosphate isomerase
MLESGKQVAGVKALDIMTRNPKTIDQSEFAVRALQIMQEKSITQLVVTNGKGIAGFVHLHDLLKEGIV